jgi:hypothetical protein
MRAKFINEFERGLDPKTALGIGPRVFKIRKCFRDLDIPDEKYTITPTNVIYNGYLDLGGKNVTWLPDNLSINSSLDLKYTPITKLPDNLEIQGNLWLGDSKITELPDDLQVTEAIWARSHQKKLIAFMQNSIFKDKLNVWY